eukprot:gnl/Chilomastix_caulleri/1207.p1 GENE.gnl/Chilomastix_caulleri/1207~~gnl/Chilomastix_caulleri/1207.p1  ORF type:complete len:179 (-),score=16.35 gnl/Chilomastix_caulleri/1207:79-615(-)
MEDRPGRPRQLKLPDRTLVAFFTMTEGDPKGAWSVGMLREVGKDEATIADADGLARNGDKKVKLEDVYLYPSNTDTHPPPGELVFAPWMNEEGTWTTVLYAAYVVDYFTRETYENMRRNGKIRDARGVDGCFFHSVFADLQTTSIMVRLRYFGDKRLFIIPSWCLFRIPLDRTSFFSK